MKKKIRFFRAQTAVLTGLLSVSAPGEDLTEYDCLIEPHTVVEVGSAQEGVIEAIHVEKNDLVEVGQVLAELESSVEKATVKMAQARTGMDAEVQAKQANLEFAERRQERVGELLNKQVISKYEGDEVKTQLKVAQSELREAQEKRTLAQFELQRAVSALERRTIRSPIKGVVVERYVSIGEFVSDQPLFKLAQMDPLRVEVILPASAYGTVEPGMDGKLVPEYPAGQVYRARVDIVDRVIDAASGTFGVRLALPNPEYRIPGGLKCTVQFAAAATLADAPAASDDTTPANEPPAGIDSAKGQSLSPPLAGTNGTSAPKATQEEGRGCQSLGPFDSRSQAEETASALEKNGFAVAVSEKNNDIMLGYFVLPATPGDKTDARDLLARLRASGFKDTTIITSQITYQGRVEAGFFGIEGPAAKRRDELIAKGFAAELKPFYRESNAYWLHIKNTKPLDASAILLAASLDPGIRLEAIPCADTSRR